MGDETIPAHVRAFITEYVDSVMQLEVLLLVAKQPQRGWAASDLARELRIDPAWVDAQLRGMSAQGLMEPATGSPAHYRFQPRTPDLGRAVADLTGAYADRRVTVIGLIFSKPVDKLRSFADAFKIRKDPSDG